MVGSLLRWVDSRFALPGIPATSEKGAMTESGGMTVLSSIRQQSRMIVRLPYYFKIPR
jgi:hypothetical protein